MQGHLKFYSATRNFGFIKPDAGTDIFVHGGQFLQHDIAKEGDRIEYEIGQSRDGRPCAMNARIVDPTVAAVADSAFRR